MSKKAMLELLAYISERLNDMVLQKEFVNFYDEHKTDALSDEMLGGRLDSDIVTFQMMRWLINEFEKEQGLQLTYSQEMIYS